MSACPAIPNTDLSISNSPVDEWYLDNQGESVRSLAPQNASTSTGCGRGTVSPNALMHRIEILEAA